MEQKYGEEIIEGQRKEKLLLASRMLETGSEEDFIVKITALELEEIIRLKEKFKSKKS
ncbi:MAG: hypothetical protein K2W94_02525 [Alphaproteobacteria bacterium]|nr:hypothetical protein [Alphaproteobacteria bacterium]